MTETISDYVTIECEGKTIGAVRSMMYVADKDSVDIDASCVRFDTPFVFSNFTQGLIYPDCQRKPLTFVLPNKKINCVWVKAAPYATYRSDEFIIAEGVSFEGLAITDR